MIIDIARHGITPSNIGFQAELFPNGPENLTSKGFLECFEEGMKMAQELRNFSEFKISATNITRT